MAISEIQLMSGQGYCLGSMADISLRSNNQTNQSQSHSLCSKGQRFKGILLKTYAHKLQATRTSHFTCSQANTRLVVTCSYSFYLLEVFKMVLREVLFVTLFCNKIFPKRSHTFPDHNKYFSHSCSCRELHQALS